MAAGPHYAFLADLDISNNWEYYIASTPRFRLVNPEALGPM